MDVNTSLQNMRSAIAVYNTLDDEDLEGRAEIGDMVVEAAEAIDKWISRGGYLPSAWFHTDLAKVAQ